MLFVVCLPVAAQQATKTFKIGYLSALSQYLRRLVGPHLCSQGVR